MSARVVTGGLLVASLAAPAALAAVSTTSVDRPVATGIANPAVVFHDGRWYTGSTGAWDDPGTIRSAPELVGPWTSTGQPMLSRKAAWMGQNKGTWAPSIIQSRTGDFRMFFSAPIPTRGDKGAERCIGVARAAHPRGPFVPYDTPVACFSGSGAGGQDLIADESAGFPNRAFSLIDPTASWLDDVLVLTYKTQFAEEPGQNPLWHTTTRMVRLDPDNPQKVIANPVHADGGSVKLTDRTNIYIEENPVLIKRSGTFTLFTSWGWYGTCNYVTDWRQNGSLWSGWLAKTPTKLSFASSVNTCGTGNAHVTRGLPEGSWRIVFNGHPDEATAGGPDGLYIGNLGWDGEGRPRVTGLLR
ncbi:family 43 glycosylhydrolase [Archangium primigenium]|uniref:family 43 glycosylhydrolase n=1 Tax=[Archangium] primigenium TaxID=2792470 RepID=UPI00195CD655|nr:family 43 glycosylhydrolase [Archangium primigenium]MBM7115979.1 family 43 glycosylhydrolase [Archangium primigenium]